MYFLNVDESGDPGNDLSASSHFILAGIITPAKFWLRTSNRLIAFRKDLFQTYGINPQDEFHASEMVRVHSQSSIRNIRKAQRIEILKHYAVNMYYLFEDSHVLTVDIDKRHFPMQTNFLPFAWRELICRYNHFLLRQNDGYGIIIADEGANAVIRQTSRAQRGVQPAMGGFKSNTDFVRVLEDPFHRDSRHSYFIQSADLVAHLRYRQLFPQTSTRKFNLDKLFGYIEPLVFPGNQQ